MSDLAKKCAERLRKMAVVGKSFDRPAGDDVSAEMQALAAFIERAQACRNDLDDYRVATDSADAYDAALCDLAQAMELE